MAKKKTSLIDKILILRRLLEIKKNKEIKRKNNIIMLQNYFSGSLYDE